MGTNYYAVKNKPTVSSPIHIGKSSMGWKFCFHRVEIKVVNLKFNEGEQDDL